MNITELSSFVDSFSDSKKDGQYVSMVDISYVDYSFVESVTFEQSLLQADLIPVIPEDGIENTSMEIYADVEEEFNGVVEEQSKELI